MTLAPTAAAVVVLAAGEGTRMKSRTAKVLHTMCGRSLVGHVLAAAGPLEAARTVVVVGHGRDQVAAHLKELLPEAQTVVQEEQRGTGHAVEVALEAVPDLRGTVVVLPGDTPLLAAGTLRRLLERHATTRAAATLVTGRPPNPHGYGRIVRDGDGHVRAIVEERDADDATRQIDEINAGFYAFEAEALRGCLPRLEAENAQGELYLTDVISMLIGDGQVVASVEATDWRESLGVNDRVQLADAARLLRDRIVEDWMREGVTVEDPSTTWIDAQVRLEPDVTLHPNVQLQGQTTIARDAHVGPDCTLTDTDVGEGARVVRTVSDSARIGPEATVGPFTYLRPGTRLGRGAKAGGFVEMKAAVVGAESKVPHLSYVGDATIGERSNIGAATVFVNYDGQDKHKTVVGDDVRIGSDTMLVAPVEIGDGAYTAAGSVIDKDVPPGSLGVGRARQRNIDGWVERRRSGSPAAEAARRARGDDAAGQDHAAGETDRSDDQDQGATP